MAGPNQPVISSLRFEARVYNDGVAIRYAIPSNELYSSSTSLELTKFNFAGDYTAWFYNGEHENIGPEKLSETNGKRMPVMTIKVNQDNYLAIHEANLAMGDPLVLE